MFTLLRSEYIRIYSICGNMKNLWSSPEVGLSACDLLQPLLQHEELGEVPLLRLCGLLLVVSSEMLHLLPVTLLQLELLFPLFSPQPP